MESLMMEKTRGKDFRKYDEKIIKEEQERRLKGGVVQAEVRTDIFEESKRTRSKAVMDKAREAMVAAKERRGATKRLRMSAHHSGQAAGAPPLAVAADAPPSE
eukprot:3876326-Lingulodinium_polyedra.AAC.1